MFFAGDGDDLVVAGDGWAASSVFGFSGDDNIQMGTGSGSYRAVGGKGDDTIKGVPYDEVDVIPGITDFMYGNDGNDLIIGSHKITGIQRLFGGTGDDKIVGGDEVVA